MKHSNTFVKLIGEFREDQGNANKGLGYTIGEIRAFNQAIKATKNIEAALQGGYDDRRLAMKQAGKGDDLTYEYYLKYINSFGVDNL